ncbi:hypothetical protein VPH35_043201 [Triticum aestivum]
MWATVKSGIRRGGHCSPGSGTPPVVGALDHARGLQPCAPRGSSIHARTRPRRAPVRGAQRRSGQPQRTPSSLPGVPQRRRRGRARPGRSGSGYPRSSTAPPPPPREGDSTWVMKVARATTRRTSMPWASREQDPRSALSPSSSRRPWHRIYSRPTITDTAVCLSLHGVPHRCRRGGARLHGRALGLRPFLGTPARFLVGSISGATGLRGRVVVGALDMGDGDGEGEEDVMEELRLQDAHRHIQAVLHLIYVRSRIKTVVHCSHWVFYLLVKELRACSTRSDTSIRRRRCTIGKSIGVMLYCGKSWEKIFTRK